MGKTFKCVAKHSIESPVNNSQKKKKKAVMERIHKKENPYIEQNLTTPKKMVE